MGDVTYADIMAFEPLDEDDQKMIIDRLLNILKNSGFEVGRTDLPGTFFFDFEVPFEGSESLIYPSFFWVDEFSMLNINIRVAGDSETCPLQRRYFKSIDYLKVIFQTGLEVNRHRGECYWTWKSIPLHPATITDTLERVLNLIQFRLGQYYELFCLMDENATDVAVLEKARLLDDLLVSEAASLHYH